jgi:hypothetical protein
MGDAICVCRPPICNWLFFLIEVPQGLQHCMFPVTQRWPCFHVMACNANCEVANRVLAIVANLYNL